MIGEDPGGPLPSGPRARVWAVSAAIGLVALGVLWLTGGLAAFAAGVQRGGAYVASEYGLDLGYTVAGFATAQVVYIWSVVMMLHEAGTRRVTWADIRRFKLRDLDLASRRMMGWLAVNRMSWIVFWSVVIVVTWGRVPWWATAAAFADNASTIFWWIIAASGLNLPWWNRAHRPDGPSPGESAGE